MKNAARTTRFDLRRAATCATLATLTTLGMFSLIANVMPPLVADGLVLASSRDTVCVPASHVVEGGSFRELSVI